MLDSILNNIDRFYQEYVADDIALVIVIGYLIFAATLFYVFSSSSRIQNSVYRRIKRMADNAPSQGGDKLSRDRKRNIIREVEDASSVKMRAAGFFQSLLGFLNLDPVKISQRLEQAGSRNPEDVTRYILMRGIATVSMPFIAWILGGVYGLDVFMRLALSIFSGFGAGIFVDVMVDQRISYRKKRLMIEFPVVLDVFSIYFEAGQATDETIRNTIKSLKYGFSVATDELDSLMDELDITLDRVATFRRFAARHNIDSINGFVSIIIQYETRGASITDSIRVLSLESKKQLFREIEQKAQKLPSLMQLPMFLFILPALFSVVIGPAALRIMKAFY